MDHEIRSPRSAARTLVFSLRRSVIILLALGLAACQQQLQTPSDLLFAPTFSKNRSDIPYTRGTQFDCRNFSGSGWKGIASGVVYNFDQRYQISQAGCFASQQECTAWLYVMRSYIDVPRFIRCNPHTA